MLKQKTLSYLGTAIFLLGCWSAAAEVARLPVIPLPAVVLARLGELFYGTIAVHACYSLLRIAGGVCLAVLLGYPLGVLLGYLPRCNRLLSPLVYLTYPVPKVALLPIIMLLLGIGEGAKILLLFCIIVFQIVLAVRDSVRTIPEEYFAVLLSLGAPFSSILLKIIIPAAWPKFFSALRVALATAISVLFFAETFGTKYGIGYYIMDAWLRINYVEMYCGIVVLSLMGIFIFTLIDCLEKYICCWQGANRS